MAEVPILAECHTTTTSVTGGVGGVEYSRIHIPSSRIYISSIGFSNVIHNLVDFFRSESHPIGLVRHSA